MASDAQIAANRLNSQNSTGPRTQTGKAASSQNATKHGLYAEILVIDDENAADFESLQLAWFDDCRPQGQREIALVQELVRCDWLTRRTTALETQLWNQKIDDRREWLHQNFDESTPLAHGYTQLTNTLVLIQRRLTALSRSFHKALNGLERLQTARSKPGAPCAPEIGFVPKPASAPETASCPPVATPAAPVHRPEIGFVPHLVSPPTRGDLAEHPQPSPSVPAFWHTEESSNPTHR